MVFKDKRFGLVVSKAEQEAVFKAAKVKGVSASEFVRGAAIPAAEMVLAKVEADSKITNPAQLRSARYAEAIASLHADGLRTVTALFDAGRFGNPETAGEFDRLADELLWLITLAKNLNASGRPQEGVNE